MIIKNLVKKYKNFELSINGLTFDDVGLIGLIGDNGAGKTTFMQLLAGKIRANIQNVNMFDTAKIYGNNRIYQNSFYISSDTAFKGKLKNIIDDFYLLYKGFDVEKCYKFIDIFRLDTGTRYADLSQGMKVQFKLAIAQALPAKVLYLDEITNGLDVTSREIVYEYIKSLSKTKLIFLSTHILDKGTEYFDRILFIDNGKVRIDISADQSLIMESGEYKVIDNTVAGNNICYDIIEVYKAIGEEKARNIIDVGD